MRITHLEKSSCRLGLFETTTDLDCSSMLKTGIEIAQHLARARALFARCEASPSSLRCSGLQLSMMSGCPVASVFEVLKWCSLWNPCMFGKILRGIVNLSPLFINLIH